jgi:2-oxoglutarate ferredoxin oxidoreductase subunit beta
MSGIGCSSKTTAYFMKQSHGFNSVHGRMPSVTSGAAAANKVAHLHRHLRRRRLAVDRPRAALHAIRRNVNMLYVIENNGVYGLTKGQFSASADIGSHEQEGRGQRRRRRSTPCCSR